jgi:hypothetical protein
LESLVVDGKYDESFKFRALSASAVMAFDGQTDLKSPVEQSHLILISKKFRETLNPVLDANTRREELVELLGIFRPDDSHGLRRLNVCPAL